MNGAWAYDSRHVAASVDNQLHVVDVTTGQDTSLGAGSHPGWTADNQILAVRQGNVWLIPYPAASGTPQALTSFAPSGDGSWTFFGPLVYQYTNKVVFAGAPTASLQANGNGIRVESVDMPTHRVTELLPAGGADLGTLALSPSETQLAVAEQAATDACASQGQIRVVRVAGGAATTVPLGAGNPSAFAVQGLTWSPDQWLAYGGVERTCANGQATAAGPAHVYLVNPASPGTPRAIVEGADPVWVMPRGLGVVPAGAVAGR